MTDTNSFVNNANRDRLKKDEEELKKLEDENTPKEEDVKPKEEEPSTPEEANFKKRYADLRRYSQENENKLQKQIADLQDKVKTTAETSLPSTKEEVEAWVKKYPDVANIVKSLADEVAETKSADISDKIKKLEEKSEEIAAEKAEQALLKIHPDFKEIKEKPEFFDWLDDQPKYIQDALYSGLDVKGAARAIDLYKNDKGIVKRDKRQEAAEVIKTKTGNNAPDADEKPVWSESKVERLKNHEYEKFEEEIMASMQKGTFVYDITGAAR